MNNDDIWRIAQESVTGLPVDASAPPLAEVLEEARTLMEASPEPRLAAPNMTTLAALDAWRLAQQTYPGTDYTLTMTSGTAPPMPTSGPFDPENDAPDDEVPTWIDDQGIVHLGESPPHFAPRPVDTATGWPPEHVSPEGNPEPTSPLPERTALYVNQLQAQTGKRLTPDQLELFRGLGDDKKAMNKVFFELGVAQNNASSEKIAALTELLAKRHKESRIRKIKELHDREETALRQARERMQSADAYLEQAANIRTERELFEGTSPNIEDILTGISGQGFWTLHDVRAEAIEFLSNNVILTHKNDQQGVDMTVNFGVFKLVWTPLTSSVRLRPFVDTLNLNGYAHPHVNEDGSVCWGNAGSALVESLRKYDVKAMLALAYSLLHTYNPNSPYVRLEEFYLLQNPKEMQGETVMHSDYRAWVSERHLPASLPDHTDERETGNEREDADGDYTMEMEYYVRIYQTFNKKYMVAIDDKYYVRAQNNRYMEIDKDDIND